MNLKLKNRLIKIAKEKIPCSDTAHDFEHAYRVLSNAERISKIENGDLDVIVPAALFHDLIVYPKNSLNTHKSQKESAKATVAILNSIPNYPKDKIKKVETCILECSFTKGIQPTILESKILQDSDRLESTGAISIMRTYSSTGQMKRQFYNSIDPFCKNRKPDGINFALDFFYVKLLKVADQMNTKTAKKIAKRRTKFLISFLNEFKLELEGK